MLSGAWLSVNRILFLLYLYNGLAKRDVQLFARNIFLPTHTHTAIVPRHTFIALKRACFTLYDDVYFQRLYIQHSNI